MSANISHSIRFAKGLFVKILKARPIAGRYIATSLERVPDDRRFLLSWLLPEAGRLKAKGGVESVEFLRDSIGPRALLY